jgi:hypothetical protein
VLHLLDSLLHSLGAGGTAMTKRFLILGLIISFFSQFECLGDDNLYLGDIKQGKGIYMPDARGVNQSPYAQAQRAAKQEADDAAKAAADQEKAYNAQVSQRSQAIAKAQLLYAAWRRDQLGSSSDAQLIEKLRAEQEETRQELADLDRTLKAARKNHETIDPADRRRQVQLRNGLAQRGRMIASLDRRMKGDSELPEMLADYQRNKGTDDLPNNIRQQLAKVGEQPTAPEKKVQVASARTQPANVPADLVGEPCESHVIQRPTVSMPRLNGTNGREYLAASRQNAPDQFVACKFPPDSRQWHLEKKGTHFFDVRGSDGWGYMISFVPQARGGVLPCRTSGSPCSSIVDKATQLAMTATFPAEELALNQRLQGRAPKTWSEIQEMKDLTAWMAQTGARPLSDPTLIARSTRRARPTHGDPVAPASPAAVADTDRPVAPVQAAPSSEVEAPAAPVISAGGM